MPANLPSSAQALVPYTGYYPLPSVPGAFVTVDTSMTSSGDTVSYDASVTISTDGLNSTQYAASACALDGNTLEGGRTGEPVGMVGSQRRAAAAGRLAPVRFRHVRHCIRIARRR